MSATESATALATAACAGPNIWTAWAAPLIVTLFIMIVAGFGIRLGASTARSAVCPWFWLTRALANAAPTGPFLGPIRRSIWATSLPSPTSDSPIRMSFMRIPPQDDGTRPTGHALA